jgi:hypothetical protein
MVLVPRDTEYEKLCGLAKASHRNDLRLNPALASWLKQGLNENGDAKEQLIQ